MSAAIKSDNSINGMKTGIAIAITKKNYSINMDSTIAGSVNAVVN
jgi:hypothetical protein